MSINPTEPRVTPVTPPYKPRPKDEKDPAEPFPKPMVKEDSAEMPKPSEPVDSTDEPNTEGEQLPELTREELAELQKSVDGGVSPAEAIRRYGENK